MVQPLSIVIRLTDVSIPQSELEATLGRALDRYEETSEHAKNYAQIDIDEEEDYWAAVHRFFQPMKDKLQALSSAGSIGALTIDAALPFRDGVMSASAVIPSALAQLAGQIGIDIQISIYRSSSPDSAHRKT
jgi:hypothetical protein